MIDIPADALGDPSAKRRQPELGRTGNLTMNALVASYARLTNLLEGAWYAIPLRLIVGYGFMEHGYAKLARGPESFVNILHAIGVPDPSLLGGLTILVELIGGFAILLGAFIPLVS